PVIFISPSSRGNRGLVKRSGAAGLPAPGFPQASLSARLLVLEERHFCLGVGQLLYQLAAAEMEEVETAPRGWPPVDLKGTAPTGHHLPGVGVNEQVFVEQPHRAERTGELGREGGTDRCLAFIPRAVELVVDGIVGEERHHRVEIVTVERLDKPRGQINKLLAFHDCRPPVGWAPPTVPAPATAATCAQRTLPRSCPNAVRSRPSHFRYTSATDAERPPARHPQYS